MTHFLEKSAQKWSGQALTGDAGPLQARDPRLRVVMAVLFACLVVTLDRFPSLLAALALAAGFAWTARLPWGPSLRRMAAMDGFMVLVLVTLPFSMPGTPLFTLWGLEASREGLLEATRIALKANAIVLALLGLLGSLSAGVLGEALGRLGLPDRLVQLLLLTVRYIDVLYCEYHRLRLSMRARAFKAGNNLHTYRSIGYLMGMLLVRSLERSERILAAMKCRGYDGRLYSLTDFTWQRGDSVLAGVTIVLLGGLLVLEHS